jgi:hypothetical protein
LSFFTSPLIAVAGELAVCMSDPTRTIVSVGLLAPAPAGAVFATDASGRTVIRAIALIRTRGSLNQCVVPRICRAANLDWPCGRFLRSQSRDSRALAFAAVIRGLRVAAFVTTLVLTTATAAAASGGVLRISADPFTNPTSQHRTQVEPDSFAFGSTIVSAFQSGRFFSGGASDIGWATSTDNGHTWTNGFLSGITTFEGNGPYERASDPSVAYDARHGVWLVASLAFSDSTSASAVVVSRSVDGGVTWSASPSTVAGGANSAFLDKDWIVCDNTATSPYYGQCYSEYDVAGSGAVHMAVSGDGGTTWSQGAVARGTRGIGGQPLVQPNGRVIVPYVSSGVRAITSNDGGATYSASKKVATIRAHRVAGHLRTSSLPSAEIDAAGTVYLVWQDCRFRSNCRENDIVMTTSVNGTTWTPVVRIPIDATTSTVDHFIPGIGVDPATQGSTAHIALAYYFYPNTTCTTSTCQLDVGYVSSIDGGSSWSNSRTLAGPMSLSWLPKTNQGVMVGDYISTSIAGGTALPVFADAHAPNNGFDVATATIADGLAVGGT